MSAGQYDYLIVGSGIYGSVFAHEATKAGKKCLVIDRRDHAGGNVFCKNVEGINVHQYGPHIFHTNDKDIWDYVNSFVPFNRYTHSPHAVYKGKVYNLPFNMNTFYQLWGLTTPAEVQAHIQAQIETLGIKEATNLEEQALLLVGPDIYNILIKGYTMKQWGRDAKELPAFIIKRLPLRFTYDNNYFNDKYQGIPIGGYNKLIEGLLDGIEVRTGADFFKDRAHWESVAQHVVFTGKIDEYFDYQFGQLEYRTLRFESEILEIENYQGNTQVNYTDIDVPYTRIVEHKHFEFGKQPHTVITREYSETWTPGAEPYYPVNDAKNNAMAKQYKDMAAAIKDKVTFGGRLAEYFYYDMHQVIASALKETREVFGKS